jgi:flagellar biosynthesis protein
MRRLALKAEALLAQDKKTRKAVALAYEINSAAPRITGQGEGFVADAILAKAKEMGIPTRSEPELVEFLMQLKLNELVPPKLYAAVAEVLAWAYELDGKVIPKPENIADR